MHNLDDMLGMVFVLSLLIAVSFFIPTNMTGKLLEVHRPDINVSIREKIDIEFTALDYQGTIFLWDTQNITVEVTNTGSTTYNATMTTYVYNLTNGTVLNLLSTYTDFTQLLYPGNSRGQRYIFAPAEVGDYFIRASVRYGARVQEAWGSFKVTTEQPPPGQGNQTNQTNQTNGTGGQPPPGTGGLPPTGGGGGAGAGGGIGGGGEGEGPNAGGGGGGAGGGNATGPARVRITIPPVPPMELLGVPLIKLDYPERIIVYRNMSSLLNIKVSNAGTAKIDNLMLYLSTPATFKTDINPKKPQFLIMNQSVMYIVSLSTSDAAVGEYMLEFKFLAPGLSKEGSVLIEVRESPESLKDFIEKRIVNYEFLVSEISAETEGVAIRGYDASQPAGFLLSAKSGLEKARAYYGDKEYVKAYGELLDVEQNIKDAVFTLGNISIRFYARGEPPYLILIFLVPLALFLLIIYKRKERRPRLLREAKEE
jgi:hypothetical protein